MNGNQVGGLVIHKARGKRVEFCVLPGFVAKYRDLLREHLAVAGQEVLQLPDENTP